MKFPLYLGCASCLGLSSPAWAGDVFKASNGTSLNQTAAWTGGVLPNGSDVAVWDAPYNVNPSLSSTLGASATWAGIRVASPATTPRVRNTAGALLTLGAGGIDMSAGSGNFEMYAALKAGASQSWNVATGRTLTIQGDLQGAGVAITKTGAGTLALTSTALTYPGAFTLNGGTLQVSGASGTQEFSGPITGAAPLAKSGAGVLTLSGDNSGFGGGVTLAAGQLNLNHASALGSGVFVISGGSIDNTKGSPLTLDGAAPVAWNGDFTYVGASSSSLDLGPTAASIAGGRSVTVGGGSLILGNNTSITGGTGAALTKLGAGLLDCGTGSSVDLPGKIAVGGGTLRLSGGSVACGSSSGNLELNGGAVELNSGTLLVRSITRTGAGSSFRFNGGTLKPRADSSTFMSGVDNATVGSGGAVIDLDGWYVTMAQPLQHDPTLGGTADAGLWIKDGFGSGRLMLTGACGYTGPTVIESGTLAMGSGASLANSPIIDVKALGVFDAQTSASIASGQTLQGTGTVMGSLTVGAGGNLSPAGASIGGMTMTDSLKLQGNATFQINKSGATLTNDSVTGLVQVIYGGTLTVTASGDALAAGDSFKLFDAGTHAGDFVTFALPALAPGLFWETAGLLVDGSIKVVNTLPSPAFNPPAGSCFASQILTITGVSGSTIHYTMDGSDPLTSPTKISVASPATGITVPVGSPSFTIKAYVTKAGYSNSAVVVADYVIVDVGTWITAGSGNWSDGPNWQDGLVAQGSGVTADFSTLSLNSNATVTLDSSRVIGNLSFGSTNNLADWTLQAASGATLTLDAASAQPVVHVNNRTATISAVVAGTQGFEKTGSGSLVLTEANTFSGGTRISGGTLRIGNGGTTGSPGAGTIENNGILELYRSDAYTVSNTISGNGKIYVKPGGTLSLTGGVSCATLRAQDGGSRTVILGGTAPNTINALETNQDGNCNWVFAKPAGVNAFSGPSLDVGNGYNSTSRLRLDNDEQIPNTTRVNLYGTQPYYSGHNYFDLNGHNETIAGVVSSNIWTHVQNGTATPCVLTLSGSDSYSFTGSVNDGSTGSLSIVWNGSGTQTFMGSTIDYTGSTTVNSGRLVFSGNDDTWTSAINIAAGAVVEINRDGSDSYEHRNAFTLSGAGTLEKTGVGNMDMNWDRGGSVAMTSGGLIRVKEGTLRLGYGSLSNWSGNKGDLRIDGGATFDLWDNNNAGVFVNALDGSGSITRSNNAQTGSFTVGVDNGGGIFSGVISNASGTTNIIKTGAGTQVFSGASTYSGNTTVNGGTLLVNNSTGSGTGSGAVVVNNSATLGGTGTISGALTVNATATLAPGNNGVGTLSTGATTLAGTYQCQISGSTLDHLAVTGNLNLTGSTLVVSTVSAATPGTYVIATYTGTLTGTFGSVTPGYTVDYSTPGQIKLAVSGTGNAYDSWVGGYGLSGSNALPAADPDKDGIANSIEFVLGGNPATVQDQSLLPTVALVTNPGGSVPNGDYLRFTYRRTPASAYLNPDMQFDADLSGAWTGATGASGVVQVVTAGFYTTPTTADKVDVYVPRAGNAVNGKLFGRLSVVAP